MASARSKTSTPPRKIRNSAKLRGSSLISIAFHGGGRGHIGQRHAAVKVVKRPPLNRMIRLSPAHDVTARPHSLDPHVGDERFRLIAACFHPDEGSLRTTCILRRHDKAIFPRLLSLLQPCIHVRSR